MTAVSAVLDPLKPNGQPWDAARDKFGGSDPDPFVQLEVPTGNPIGLTDTLIDTTTPVWNQLLSLAQVPGSFKAGDLLAGGSDFSLWVGDADGVLLADPMCEITTPLDPDAFLTRNLTFTSVGSCQVLTLTLVCNP